MKPFIQGETERLENALNPLKELSRRLSILKDLDPVKKPHSFKKAQENIERCYNEYETAKAKILKYWESEEKPEEKTNMQIAEDHNWHTHEQM